MGDITAGPWTRLLSLLRPLPSLPQHDPPRPNRFLHPQAHQGQSGQDGWLALGCPCPKGHPRCPPVLLAQLRGSGRGRAHSGSEGLGSARGGLGSGVAAGVRSRPRRVGLTPPGGVSGKSLKARAPRRPAHSSGSRRARRPLPPAPPEVSAERRPQSGSGGGGPGRPRARQAPGPASAGGRRPSLLKASEGGQPERRSAGAGMARVAESGAVRGGLPRRGSGETPARGARRRPGPAPRALGALWPRSQRAPACCSRRRLRAFPPARPGPSAALSPRGRARSRRRMVLGGPPRPPPRPRRARAPGHPARPRRCAPRLPHLQPLAIFTPPSAPAPAPDSVLSN